MAQTTTKRSFLPRLTTFFFDRPRLTAIIWLAVALFGIASYTTLLRREGFPSVNIPISVISGTYYVNDPARVDHEVAAPITNEALKLGEVKTVETQSSDNFFAITVQYSEKTDAAAATKQLQQKLESSAALPKSAQVKYNVPYFGPTGGDIQPIDLAISFFKSDNQTATADLVKQAEAAAKWLGDQKITGVKAVFVKSPYQTITDPQTGQPATIQQNFDRYSNRQNNQNLSYNSVIIGVTKDQNVDVIKVDDQVRQAAARLQNQPQFKGYRAEVSASFAPSIKDSLSELQRVLLEGLLAVLVVGSLVIAIRASLITVISMVTVLVLTLGFLFLIGYTLNVITLFALILGLALIVDDTIIMVEAIDAARRHQTDPRQTVKEATQKVSRAMLAATLTACLSFAPLLFVGGILGSFIRAIPITIIAALIISLLIAWIFIPLFARFLLLGKNQMGATGVKEVGAKFEARIGRFIAAPMLWARRSRRRLFGVGLAALFTGLAFIVAGLFIARNVVFNIFPPTKDTNGLVLSVNFPPNTTTVQAEKISAEVDKIAADTIGSNFIQSSYYGSGSAQSATSQIEIISYTKRDITSPELVNQLKDKFSKFSGAQVGVAQTDIGPPSAPFTVQFDATNRPAAFAAAQDLASFMKSAELKRINGKTAHYTNVTVSSPNQYLRSKDKSIVTVSAGFDGNDTTTLVTLAQDQVKKEFDTQKLQQYNLDQKAMTFDLGQESENQDSFRTLALAFPILLVAMYVLLGIQFRSFLQPLLIFMAIPFSLFGVMLGLSLTHNAISFFTMLGFFALVGLSIKNTILLTDFANQAKRSGLGPVDSAVAALEERFRPLFATSLTAVVSLIPLAIASPFWQGLAVVLIFGLLSSTFLVVTVFPYYYLGVEYTRRHIAWRDFVIWAVITGVVTAGVIAITKSAFYGLLVVVASILLTWLLGL
jgi:multidrug efflux pump subunit AcrB